MSVPLFPTHLGDAPVASTTSRKPQARLRRYRVLALRAEIRAGLGHQEWNYVKDWIHLAEVAVQKSHFAAFRDCVPAKLKKRQCDGASR
jgi:hypothetical protein